MNIEAILKLNPLKIELGANTRPQKKRKDGWIFNDIQSLPGIDLVAPIMNLGLPNNSVDSLSSHHVIEHIPSDLTKKLLSYWFNLLKSGGILEIGCPNAEYGMKEFLKCSQEGKSPVAMVYRVIWGTRDGGTEALPPFNQHFTGFSLKLLANFLKETGFKDVVVEHVNRFGIPDRDLKARGIKP